MAMDFPNRDGWVTGALAALPPCPPFPEFTSFKTRALDCIAGLFGADESAFRQQLAASRVVDRIKTFAGFYTRVVVDRSICQPVKLNRMGGQFEVEGIEYGVGLVLWGEDRFLDQIEGYTYTDSPLQGVDLAQLKFVAAELG